MPGFDKGHFQWNLLVFYLSKDTINIKRTSICSLEEPEDNLPMVAIPLASDKNDKSHTVSYDGGRIPIDFVYAYTVVEVAF